MTERRTTDLLIAGGGLAAGLLALAVRARRPGTRVTIVEAGERLGGHHLWSFFRSDVAEEDLPLLERIVAYRWGGYSVAFPGFTRALNTPYHTIESERMDAVLRQTLPDEDVLTGRRVRALDRGTAFLHDGTAIDAEAIVDARGFARTDALTVGWQKFVGQLLRLESPHGLDRPVIMDATVDQVDGFRFVYLLPFSPTEMFVEDTYYDRSPTIDAPLLKARIADYAAARGWRVASIEREEQSALPIATGGNFEQLWRAGAQGVGKIGMAAALFHPLTGYSLPDAMRTASLLAALPRLTTDTAHDALKAHAEKAWHDRGYYRLLTRLLFDAADPPERYRMLARFYQLRPNLIRRFYAAESTRLDKVRVLCGRPPVPLLRAAQVALKGEE